MPTVYVPHLHLPIRFDRPGATRVDPTKLSPLYPLDLELDAVDQWLWGPDAGSLVSQVGDLSTMTAIDEAPSYGTTYVLPAIGHSGHIANGLSSGFADASTYTVVCVNQFTAATTCRLFGNTDAGGANGGSMLSWSGGVLTGLVRGSAITDQTITPSAPAGSVLFTAHVIDSGSSFWTYIGGQGKSTTRTGTRVASTIPHVFAWGNGYHTGPGTEISVTPLYEGIIYNRALSEAELDAVYARSVIRGVQRGYTVWEP